MSKPDVVELHIQVAKELKDGVRDEALWDRATNASGGNLQKTRAIYRDLRVEQISSQHGASQDIKPTPRRLDNETKTQESTDILSANCPVCGSENIQRLSIIHDSGLFNVNLTTTGTSVGIGAGLTVDGNVGGGVGISKSNSETSGRYQSNISKTVAPPEPIWPAIPTGVWVISVIIGFASFLQLVVNRHWWEFFGFFASIIIGVISFFLASLILIPKEHKLAALNANREAMAKWKASFMCLKCGHKFVNSNVLPQVVDAEVETPLSLSKLSFIHWTGISVVCLVIILALFGDRQNESSSSASSISNNLSEDEKNHCFTTGQNLTLVAINNYDQMPTGYTPSQLMADTCSRLGSKTKNSGECRRYCELGFRSAAKDL